MVVDIHRSSDGGLDVRNPHAQELADNVDSEPPGGQHSDYQPGDGGLGAYLLPVLGTPAPDCF